MCVSVCLVDAQLKARSAFHCSMNYRSAVIFGCAHSDHSQEKHELLDRFTEFLIPGTSDDFRAPLAKELKATELVRLPLTEFSVKIRSGDPVDDDDEDLELPHWAGIIPLHSVAGEPVSSANLPNHMRPGESLLKALRAHSTRLDISRN